MSNIFLWYSVSPDISYVPNLQPKLLDEKQTTIYKRAVDRNYHLKMKASRFIFSEISEKFRIMPFTARLVYPTISYADFKYVLFYLSSLL